MALPADPLSMVCSLDNCYVLSLNLANAENVKVSMCSHPTKTKRACIARQTQCTACVLH